MTVTVHGSLRVAVVAAIGWVDGSAGSAGSRCHAVREIRVGAVGGRIPRLVGQVRRGDAGPPLHLGDRGVHLGAHLPLARARGSFRSRPPRAPPTRRSSSSCRSRAKSTIASSRTSISGKTRANSTTDWPRWVHLGPVDRLPEAALWARNLICPLRASPDGRQDYRPGYLARYLACGACPHHMPGPGTNSPLRPASDMASLLP